MTEPEPGPRPAPSGTLTDVAGLRVGHLTRIGHGWLSGTTVVLAPEGGATAGVDVRGGGPGTRETDLLDPRATVERVHALVLTGGSAYGLAAAAGVTDRLGRAGVGLPVGGPGAVVPIVPAAVVFDLGRGGDFAARPDPELGAQAYEVAAGAGGEGPVALGCVGAGTGAVTGGLKGGIGSASAVLPGGGTVAALAVVNAAGSAVDPGSGELYGARFGLPGEFPLRRPAAAELRSARGAAEGALRPGRLPPPLATTLGVLATDATLTKAQCARVAAMGHDGMARAIRPVHTPFDGDTVFTLATGARPALDPERFYALLIAAGDCFTRAVVHAMLAATSVETPAGRWRCYREAFPSAFSASPP